MSLDDRPVADTAERGGRRPRHHRVTTLGLLAIVVCALAAAGPLALLRSTDPGWRRGIELVAFTPVGLPLALVGVVAAGILTSLVRTHRRHALLAGASCLALAALHAWWLSPLYLGDVPEAGAGERLVVMTQNFEEGDAEAVVALVHRYDVDVLVLTDSSPSQVGAVASSGILRDLPFATPHSGIGPVVWSRFPIVSDTPLGDGADSRAVVLNLPGRAPLHLVAAHPAPPYQHGGDTWHADWDLVLTHLSQAPGSAANGGVVVAGDLNATRDHAPMRTLARMGFRDVGEQLNRGLVATWPANALQQRLGMSPPALLHLDHVLTASGWVATDHVVSDAAGSDHRAVVATLAPAG